MKLTLDKSHADEVEHNITPPMAEAVTLTIPELPSVAIYVALSPFAAPRDSLTLREIVNRLELKPL